jgi:tetratricopeptide (TPR) repeat protein
VSVIAAPSPDDLLTTVRARAAAGEWADVRAVLASHVGEARAHPELITTRAEASLRTGNPREAHAWLAEAFQGLERSGDRAQLRRGLNLLGVAHTELGALDDAEATFDRAAQLGSTDGDELLVARATNNLAAIAHVRGRRDVAVALYALALPAYQRLGSARGLAESYHNLAITLREMGELERADECEQRAIEFARDAGAPALAAMARVGRAEVALRRDDTLMAEATARLAAEELARAADPIREADALRVAGVACTRRGDISAARFVLDRAVSLVREHGHMLIEAECLRARAEAALAGSDLGVAREDLRSAIDLFGRLGARVEEAEAQRRLEGMRNED